MLKFLKPSLLKIVVTLVLFIGMTWLWSLKNMFIMDALLWPAADLLHGLGSMSSGGSLFGIRFTQLWAGPRALVPRRCVPCGPILAKAEALLRRCADGARRGMMLPPAP